MRDLGLEPWLVEDVLSLFLGDLLGAGIARRVYAYAPDPEVYVVKVEVGRLDFQNVAEWELWNAASPKLEKHLAPCLSISRCGKALLQRRCEPCPTHLLPRKMPKVLADLHRDNIGLLEGRPVAMDYGRNLAHALTANAKAMQEVFGDG